MSAPHELSGSTRASGRDVLFMVIAVLVTLPWLVLRFQGYHGDPAVIAALSGLAIVGAAFILSWAAEAFEKDVSQALALALLALIAVLPEYAVDMVLAWSAIVLVAWLRFRAKKVTLERGQAIEVAILLLATLYAFTIPMRGGLSLFDTVVFVGLFGLYAWAAAKAESHEPELVGPARLVGNLSTGARRFWTLLLFLFAAGT